jgi:hypothetical protein
MTRSVTKGPSARLTRGFAGLTAASVFGNLFAYVFVLSAARILARTTTP